MNLRSPRRLTLLALVGPGLALLPTVTAAPASATRGDSVAPAYVVDEWTDSSDFSRLPAEPYSRVEVTYDATYGITRDGQVRTALPWWKTAEQVQQLTAPGFDRPIVDVTGGTTFGLAVDDQGHLRAWGSAPEIPAEDLTTTYRDVAAVSGAAIGVTSDGELRFWGNAADQYAFDPAALAAADVVSIDVDSAAAVVLTAEGHVLSAGYALDGTYYQSAPLPAERADDTYTAVDTGVSFALGLTEDGEVVSWGSYQNGEDQVPDLPAGRHAVAVSAGMWWAAAVLDDGSVVTWGNRERTQLPALRADVPVVDVDLDRYRSAVTYATLANTEAPVVSGTPQFGDELTASAGEWSSEPDEVHYEWRAHRGEDSTVVGTDDPSYSPSATDAEDGVTLTVTVTATKDGYASAGVDTAGTAPVARGTFAVSPSVSVTGTPRIGQVLSATTKAPAAATGTSYQWLRGIAPIAGATARTYRPVAADLGQALRVRATSTAAGYTAASATSAPSRAVTLGAVRLRVGVPARATVGRKAAVTVRGLAAGERFTVTVAGKRLTGRATGAGVGTVSLKVVGKPGKRAVRVVGSLADRTGAATLRVVRRR